MDRRITKEELFSGSDRWHQEKHYDLRWRLYHSENRFKTEQGGGRCSVFTGSKNRACDIESREDHGRGIGGSILVHVGTNNTDKEGTTAIVEKYRKLLKKTNQSRSPYQEYYQCVET